MYCFAGLINKMALMYMIAVLGGLD